MRQDGSISPKSDANTKHTAASTPQSRCSRDCAPLTPYTGEPGVLPHQNFFNTLKARDFFRNPGLYPIVSLFLHGCGLAFQFLLGFLLDRHFLLIVLGFLLEILLILSGLGSVNILNLLIQFLQMV